MARREFPTEVKKAAWKRSGGRCECMVARDGEMIRCDAALIPLRVEYDHRIPDQMGGDPTLDNCVASCILCHAEKTKQDVRKIARAKRLEAREINAQAQKASKLQGPAFQHQSTKRTKHPIELPPRRAMFR
jgi:hypothetical protein